MNATMTMTTSTTRQDEIKAIRKLVRGIGRVRRVWGLSVAEVRTHAARLLAERSDWTTPSEKAMLARFVGEVGR